MSRRGQDDIVGIDMLEKVGGFSSGYSFIDYVSGVPGILFPRATFVELYGMNSSSKTTLVLETIAFNQEKDKNFKVLYADYEKMLLKETSYLEELGIDLSPERFKVLTPEYMEDGNSKILQAIKDNSYDMIVIDTLAAMRPKLEDENGYGETKQMGYRGKLMSEFCRNAMANLHSDGPAIIVINQEYKDPNAKSFIPMTTTPASDSLKFYAGMRLVVKKTKNIEETYKHPFTLETTKIRVGQTVKIENVKNKVGRPYLQSNYMITLGFGIDPVPSAVAAAVRAGILKNKGKSKGAFILYTKANEGDPNKEDSVNGMGKVIHYYRDNLDDFKFLMDSINSSWASNSEDIVERLKQKEGLMKKATVDEDSYLDEHSEDNGGSVSLADIVSEDNASNVKDLIGDTDDIEDISDMTEVKETEISLVKEKENPKEEVSDTKPQKPQFKMKQKIHFGGKL